VLLAVADIDRDDPVGQFELLEHDRDLASVRRAPGIEVNHVGSALRVGKFGYLAGKGREFNLRTSSLRELSLSGTATPTAPWSAMPPSLTR
jgi:hypothetical protein